MIDMILNNSNTGYFGTLWQNYGWPGMGKRIGIWKSDTRGKLILALTILAMVRRESLPRF
jgi:hypothetical protein